MKRILSALILLSLVLISFESYAYNGEVIKFKMSDSKIYPGTARSVTVYVPEQYDGTEPACLWVSVSGGSFIFDIFDKLIADGDVPVIIGVFVAPGQIRDAQGDVVRYNRSNELDRMDGRYAEFLETEVLPVVCSHKTKDGRPIKISSRATDRAIYGSSSGGICAFNAAWQRPDLFSRVYTACGTFVL
ncbi:MAG: hypothetical protein II262_08460 [Alistipes sp.]|nr:hypothetical protein [Alistipes sp.]